MYHGRKMEHVLIELVDGNVELRIRLATGKGIFVYSKVL